MFPRGFIISHCFIAYVVKCGQILYTFQKMSKVFNSSRLIVFENKMFDKCISSSTVGCFFFHIQSPLNREACQREQSQACGYCKNSAISQQHRWLSRNWAPVSPQLHFSERAQSPTHIMYTHIMHNVGYFTPLWSLWKPCQKPSKEADLCFYFSSPAPVRHMVFSLCGW